MIDWTLNYVAYSNHDFNRDSLIKLVRLVKESLGDDGIINIAFNALNLNEKLIPSFYIDKIADIPIKKILYRDNLRREFGAWLDLNHSNKLHPCKDNALHIFANSTWDTHRDASDKILDQYATSLINFSTLKHPIFAGPISTMGKAFAINSVIVKYWVCTYLFVFNQQAINSDAFQLTPKEVISSYFGNGLNEESYFSDSIDPFLKHRWEGWFFGANQAPRWYQAKPLKDYNPQDLYTKVVSCIDEHWLTRTAISKNISLFPMHSAFTGSNKPVINKWQENKIYYSKT